MTDQQENLPEKSKDLEYNPEILEQLQRQTKLLENMQNYMTNALEKEDDRLNLRSNVTDVNMSIGNMISFMFKWLVASIPVAIVVGILYLIIFAILGGFSY